jgi:hypothetical protein
MKRNWELDEIIDHFTFLPNELTQVGNKTGETRLGFGVMFKYFQYEARFPNYKNEVPIEIIEYIAKQLDVAPFVFDKYDWSGRNIKYHRAQIRTFFGFREATTEDIQLTKEWLCKQVLYQNFEIENLKEEAYKRFRESSIEPPTLEQINRLTKSAIRTYGDQFLQETYSQLSLSTRYQMNLLIETLALYDETEADDNIEEKSMSFGDLRADPGRIGLESVFKEINKLQTIRQLNLPDNLFNKVPTKVIKRYKQRAVSEKLMELRRHPDKMLLSFGLEKGKLPIIL